MDGKLRYRGYDIVPASHPVPCNPCRVTYDIVQHDGKIRKANISTIELCKHVIDVMIKYNYWQELVG